MTRLHLLMGVAAAALAACGPGVAPVARGPDGRPAQQIYRIRPGDTARIQFRALDAVNTLRAARNLVPLELDPALTAAAATHSRDMYRQQRAWAFGSDGSSPIERVARAGFVGRMTGQLISETFEDELETINAWMADRDSRAVLLDPQARRMGFAWYQEANGKIWWTLVAGAPAVGFDGFS